jgi:hypothetical protein
MRENATGSESSTQFRKPGSAELSRRSGMTGYSFEHKYRLLPYIVGQNLSEIGQGKSKVQSNSRPQIAGY